MFLVAIGIVYGDIGTSPLYVMKSIVAGNGGIGQVNQDFIIGALSLVIWTVTLLTTIKYVLVAMKADNHGEGGIFALYSLVRNHGKWLILPAMLGGSALLADGVLPIVRTLITLVFNLVIRGMPIRYMTNILGYSFLPNIIFALPLVILGAVGGHFRRISTARTLLDHGKSSSELQRLCGIPDYPARKTMEAARRFRPEFCARAAELILETDYRMKTSFDEQERILEMLILQLAQEARNG